MADEKPEWFRGHIVLKTFWIESSDRSRVHDSATVNVILYHPDRDIAKAIGQYWNRGGVGTRLPPEFNSVFKSLRQETYVTNQENRYQSAQEGSTSGNPYDEEGRAMQEGGRARLEKTQEGASEFGFTNYRIVLVLPYSPEDFGEIYKNAKASIDAVASLATEGTDMYTSSSRFITYPAGEYLWRMKDDREGGEGTVVIVRFQHPDQRIAKYIHHMFVALNYSKGRRVPSWAKVVFDDWITSDDKVLHKWNEIVLTPRPETNNGGKLPLGLIRTDGVRRVTRQHSDKLMVLPYRPEEYGTIYDMAAKIADWEESPDSVDMYAATAVSSYSHPFFMTGYKYNGVRVDDITVKYLHPDRQIAEAITQLISNTSRDEPTDTYRHNHYTYSWHPLQDSEQYKFDEENNGDRYSGYSFRSREVTRALPSEVSEDTIFHVEFHRTQNYIDDKDWMHLSHNITIIYPYNEEKYGSLYDMAKRNPVKSSRPITVDSAPVIACRMCKDARAKFECTNCKAGYYCGEACQKVAFDADPCC